MLVQVGFFFPRGTPSLDDIIHTTRKTKAKKREEMRQTVEVSALLKRASTLVCGEGLLR